MVNQVCFKVIGNDLSVTLASEAGQLQLNVMEPVIASSLFESLSLLGNAVTALNEKCIQGITANPEICRNNVLSSIAIVTFLDPILGHETCDLIGKECAQTGKTVQEVVLNKKLLTEEQLKDIFSNENLLRPKYIGRKF